MTGGPYKVKGQEKRGHISYKNILRVLQLVENRRLRATAAHMISIQETARFCLHPHLLITGWQQCNDFLLESGQGQA